MKKFFTCIYIFTIIIAIISFFTGCSGTSEQSKQMNQAETLMESRPDSALSILNNIQPDNLNGKKQRARYALLKSMALDKNYIDTTTFDVLQPAIDYYLEKGNPDEKLKTYYYQGRILQNQGDIDKALHIFTIGVDMSRQITDSLCLARMIVAQSLTYDALYDYDNYADCNLRAAKIYKKLSLKWHEFDCLLNALNGALSLSNKSLSDSVLSLCSDFHELDSIQALSFLGYKLSYAIKFGNLQTIRSGINQINNNTNLDNDAILDQALAYHKIGNDIKAKSLLDSLNDMDPQTYLRHLSISVPILESMGNYKDALNRYKHFSNIMDSINSSRFEHKSQLIEEKYNLELKAQQDSKRNNQILWTFMGSVIFFTFAVIILILLVRSHKMQKILAMEQALTAELKNKSLISQKHKLSLENKALKLERDNKALETEILIHRVEILENECIGLKELISSQEELPREVEQAIKIRIEMLNALMATYITDNERYEKTYESWIKELSENTEEFMNSNRLAFQASHPKFIQYFKDYGLNTSEINYVCLYAIGLRGKEVGNYIKKPSHVNLSSVIRKKLGIDKRDTNIGIYVRKLLKSL